ncbi:hypothetical protein CcaverHIS631_0603030 [Cutaneotrichosporon cavernicola]|nr:hypothetical protein CcaverHIS631_0603030 [Cutaneotrichosporon cavernicola]
MNADQLNSSTAPSRLKSPNNTKFAACTSPPSTGYRLGDIYTICPNSPSPSPSANVVFERHSIPSQEYSTLYPSHYF